MTKPVDEFPIKVHRRPHVGECVAPKIPQPRMPLQNRLRAVLFGLVKLGSREVAITVMHKETLDRVEVILQRNIVGREVIYRALRVAGDATHNF